SWYGTRPPGKGRGGLPARGPTMDSGVGPPCRFRLRIRRGGGLCGPCRAGHPGTGCCGRCVFDGDARRGRSGAGIGQRNPRILACGAVPGKVGTRSPAGSAIMAAMITPKTPEQIEKMRAAGRLAAEVLQVVAPHVKPGVSTEELDRICHEHIVNVQQATPANVGYKGYPKATCISVNNVICHGIPNEAKVLKDG